VKSATPKLSALVPAWEDLRKSAPFFGPVRNERDYARMNETTEALLEEVGDDENHSLADLLDVVSTLIGEYEELHHRNLEAEPRQVLKFLTARGWNSGRSVGDLDWSSVHQCPAGKGACQAIWNLSGGISVIRNRTPS